MDQHISRLDTNTDDSGQQPNHGVGPGLRLLLQSFLTSFLDLRDLADNKAQPRHVALQLGHGIWRQRYALRGVHGCQTFGRLAQGWFEVANAQPSQGGLYPVYNARAFPHQGFALPVRPLGVLFGNRWHARHGAMAPFSTQPPQEPALQQLGVEPVGFRPAMLPRYRDTRGMDHVRLYPTRLKPARQPKAVAAGFEGQIVVSRSGFVKVNRRMNSIGVMPSSRSSRCARRQRSHCNPACFPSVGAPFAAPPRMTMPAPF